RVGRADRARDLDPVAARAGDLERGQDAVRALEPLRAGDLELRQRVAVRAVEHHVHRPAAAALGHEVLLARREHLTLRLPRLEMLEEDPEALGVDADGFA